MSSSEERLKKLIDKLGVDTGYRAEHKAKVKAEMLAVFGKCSEGSAGWRSVWRIIMESRITKYAAAAIILIAAIIGTAVLNDGVSDDAGQVAEGQKTESSEQQTEDRDVAVDDGTNGTLKEELERVQKLYAQNDVKGLVAMLEDGQYATKVIAANFLGKIGDAEAAAVLEKIAGETSVGGEVFVKAMEQIKERLADGGAVEEKEEVKTVDTNKPAEKIGAAVQKANTLYLTVIDKDTGESLSNVNIKARFDNRNAEYMTDIFGSCEIEVGAEKVTSYSVVIKKDGYVPLQIREWSNNAEIIVPAKYTLKIEKGNLIGGYVKTPEGEAAVNAEIKVSVYKPREGNIEGYYLNDVAMSTDANGFWLCNVIPSEFQNVNLTYNCPGYVNDRQHHRIDSEEFKELQDQSFIYVLKKGAFLEGIVVDDKGQPVVNANVALGEGRFDSERFKQAKTDEKGIFYFENIPTYDYRINNVEAGHVIVTVQADGFAPELMSIDVVSKTRSEEPVKFIMSKGKPFKCRVVDIDNKPVGGVKVYIDSWKEFRSIQYTFTTDKNGRVLWNNAPEDEFLCDFSKHGYYRISRKSITASDEEMEVILYPPLVVEGTVTDANTGEPIDKFKVIQGIDWFSNSNPHFNLDNVRTVTGGKYKEIFGHQYPAHLVKIEAEGYLPAISEPFTIEDGNVVYDFELVKGSGPSGVVYSPDGSVVIGCEIMVSKNGNQLFFRDGKRSNYGDARVYKTDEKGRFEMQPIDANTPVFFIDDKGYAIFTDANDFNEVNLKEWAGIEGYVYIGTKPAENAKISFYYDSQHFNNKQGDIKLSWQQSAITDANGYFVCDKLIAGMIHVSRAESKGGRTYNSNNRFVDVGNGQMEYIQMGGVGMGVKGKIVLPADCNEIVDFETSVGQIVIAIDKSEQYQEIQNMMKTYFPANYTEMTIRERVEWSKEFQDSPEAEEMQQKVQEMYSAKHNNQLSISVKFDAEGNFVANDIPSGIYNFTYELVSGENKHLPYWKQERVGMVSYEFEIPEVPGGVSDEVIDLGEIEATMNKKLEKGQYISELEMETADGEQLNISDLHGKFVLVNFWMAHVQPEESFREIAKIYEKYKTKNNFAVIGLSYDQSYYAIEGLSKEIEINWPMYYLNLSKCQFDSHEKMKYYQSLGLGYIKTNFLIGPDGKIIQADIPDNELAVEVDKALRITDSNEQKTESRNGK